MANQDYSSPNTATTLSTSPLGNSKNVRQVWRKGALVAEQSEDPFQEMESRSERGLIWAQTDLSKGNGSIMNFTTQSGFYKKPKLGDALFEGPTDFDKIRQGNFQLKVDFARWAVRVNKRMEEIMGMRGDIESGINVELGKTLGRYKAESLMALFFHKLPVANVMYANGKTRETIKSADTLRWDEVVSVGQAMKPLGGLPANVAAPGSRTPIWSQTFFAPEPAITSLKLDSAWRDVLKNGDVRGQNNTIFRGGYPSIDGHTIIPYNPIDHDGVGPMGSFMNPKAFLGNAAIAADGTGNVALDVYGGGNDTDHNEEDFFRYFAGAPYTFIDTGAITPDTTGPHYFLIYNISGAEAGKFGMYKYTSGNDGTKIRITEKFSTTGANVGTYNKNIVGNVTYSASLHSVAHPLGSLIIPCNSYGVPIGSTIVFGRAGILRGYGMYRAEHTVDMLNGKFVADRYLTSVFGQSFRYDRKDRVISAMRLDHAITYPGIKLPTVS